MKKTTLFGFLALVLIRAAGQDTISITSCTTFWQTGDPVENAMIFVGAYPPGLPPIAIFADTAACATFEEPLPLNYPPGTQFSFGAGKDDDYLNGVTILDLIAMSNHILGLEPLPLYGILAADVNQSNSITTFDIVETRKLIQGIYTELPNSSTPWRFFPETCVFSNPSNPFTGADCSNLDLAELEAWDGDILDLIGVKKGDVDGDANPAGFYAGPVFVDSLSLIFPDLLLQPGIPTTIAVTYDGDYALNGLQVEFHFDPDKIQLNDIFETEYFNASSFGVFPGVLAAVGIVHATALPAQSGDTLMKFQITANQALALADEFQIGNTIVFPFGASGLIDPLPLKIKLHYGAASVASGAPAAGGKVHPSSPNPFSDHTFIALELDRAETVRLEVFDLTGQRRHTVENLFDPGVHRLKIPAEAVTPGSIGLYRLQIGSRVETGRVVRR